MAVWQLQRAILQRRLARELRRALAWLEIAPRPNVADALQEGIRERERGQRNHLASRLPGMGTWAWDVVNGVHTWSPETEALSGLAPGV